MIEYPAFSLQADDNYFMGLALQAARKGLGRTSPNPPVGAVVVKNGRVIGCGYHHRAGEPHAEVNAIADVKEETSGATIYVTLEPCNHTGRTPPCTQAVLAAGITRVVVGVLDPNTQVAGGGCSYLQQQGVAVTSGVLEESCRELIRFFVKHNRTGLPWVAMKAGMSLDGRLSYQPRQGGRITGAAAASYTHQLRDAYDAIMVGAGTVASDDPSLTTRLPGGKGRDPLRIILDSKLSLPVTAKMLEQDSTAMTWVYCTPAASSEREKYLVAAGAVVHRVGTDAHGKVDLHQVWQHLGNHDICSVLVEGGATLHTSLLATQTADQAYLLLAPFFIGDQGTPLLREVVVNDRTQAVHLHEQQVDRIGGDILVQGRLFYPQHT
jgi:diaminohydroxyphosphoribosylaminopyrimidine deaminase/5-amino-6-(5-phosphoribosylamino)uracil reductase